jgi:molecular chaperone IbpA
MRTYDLSPLFRSTIGFDRLGRLLETAPTNDGVTYPPYNIEKLGDNAYRLTMAVAGFGPGDIDLTVQDNALTLRGKAQAEPETARFLHRGIAGRAFERHFQLAEHVEVEGARLENGLLHVDLVRRVPESAKPRKIEIASASKQTTIAQTPAAEQTNVVEQKKAA